MPVPLDEKIRRVIALACVTQLSLPFPFTAERALAEPQPQSSPAAGANEAGREAPKFSNDQLDSLVAPVALYPDQLLAQALAASTYPLELVQLQQWLAQNKNLKGKEFVAAVEKQKWDPSVQAMAAVPDVLKRMTENVKWTTDLGNAFLAQQTEVMQAVQRMRVKAKEKGALKSDDKLKVETKTLEGQSVVVIEQADPQVIYVPTYNPTVVYGAALYPYPSIYYPPPSYYAGGMFLSFSVGVAMGAAFSGGWGYHCAWGGANHVTINNNNTFVRNSNTRANVAGQTTRTTGNQWQHNPQHRGGTPYSDRGVANRYGGTASGARQQAGASGARTGADNIGNRSVSSGAGAGRGGGAWGGGSQGLSGSSAWASSSRGASSLGSSRSGGFRGGGGGFRGGGRR